MNYALLNIEKGGKLSELSSIYIPSTNSRRGLRLGWANFFLFSFQVKGRPIG